MAKTGPGPKELEVKALRLARAAGKRKPRLSITAISGVLAVGDVVRWPDGSKGKILQTASSPLAKPINAPVPASAPLKEKTMKTKSKAKKSTKAKAPKRGVSEAAANLRAAKAAGKAPRVKKARAAARTPVDGETKGVRPGSKLEIVVGLLTRPEGCTTKDILEATKWPSVSVPQMAKAAGLTLSKEKDGSVSRYRGTAAS